MKRKISASPSALVREIEELQEATSAILKERWRALYKARGAVEREFGRLKHEWAMLPLRVRGLARVALHVNLTILTKLFCFVV